MFVCMVNSLRKEIKKIKKKYKGKEGVRGSERKPVVVCFAVRCHCEFEDLSHLREAIRILEDAEGEERSLKHD